jgi:hypothetical protein
VYKGKQIAEIAENEKKSSSSLGSLLMATRLVPCASGDVDLEVPSSAPVEVPHPDTLTLQLRGSKHTPIGRIPDRRRGAKVQGRQIWITEKNLSTDEWTNRKWREGYEFEVG